MNSDSHRNNNVLQNLKVRIIYRLESLSKLRLNSKLKRSISKSTVTEEPKITSNRYYTSCNALDSLLTSNPTGVSPQPCSNYPNDFNNFVQRNPEITAVDVLAETNNRSDSSVFNFIHNVASYHDTHPKTRKNSGCKNRKKVVYPLQENTDSFCYPSTLINTGTSCKRNPSNSSLNTSTFLGRNDAVTDINSSPTSNEIFNHNFTDIKSPLEPIPITEKYAINHMKFNQMDMFSFSHSTCSHNNEIHKLEKLKKHQRQSPNIKAEKQILENNDGNNPSLIRELRELAKHGWYWGPISRGEAEQKLRNQPDGTFLVRDSSDVNYLVSLSFKSSGVTLHTRVEHSNGWFSFYSHPEEDGHRSLVGLIENCMSKSNSDVLCYSRRPLASESPSYPVRLTHPLSRFKQVPSLQYICRFLIRQYVSINHVDTLPLPSKVKDYLQENYY